MLWLLSLGFVLQSGRSKSFKYQSREAGKEQHVQYLRGYQPVFPANPVAHMSVTSRQVMDDADISRALKRIAYEILERNRGSDELVLVGIHTLGVPLSQRLGAILSDIENAVPMGSLDIGLHRDDLADRPTPRLQGTNLPVDISGKIVVLIDDVLYTGRTIRSAMDALADLGRPSAVQLAVLVDRGHRQLPIRADFVGKNLPTSDRERVTVALEPIAGVWIEEQE